MPDIHVDKYIKRSLFMCLFTAFLCMTVEKIYTVEQNLVLLCHGFTGLFTSVLIVLFNRPSSSTNKK